MAEPLPDADLHPALAAALRADRELLNQRFAARQRAGARIDEPAFQEHLRTTVNELVRGVAGVQPERVRAVVQSLFDLSLDLFAAGLLGPRTKHPHVAAAWRVVLPCAARLLARDPTRLAGCLSNAVDYLAAQPLARPTAWIESMKDLSPHCDSVPLWLEVGKVAAWRAGLVQFRPAALKLLRELPPALAKRSLGVSDDVPEPAWRERLDRLDSDRWYSPAADWADAGRTLRLVRTAGGFRGFGGPCLRPPHVAAHNGELLVSDGDATWQLLADMFGTFWHRLPAAASKPSDAATASNVSLDSAGRIAWDGMQATFAELAGAGSFACDGHTLAVTLPTSHHVFLVARSTA